jgi:hypothetical protein
MAKNLYRLIDKICDKQIEQIKRSPVNLKVPSGISTEELRTIAPESITDLNLWVDMCYVVISSIYSITVDDEKKVAYLHSRILKRQIGDHYVLVLKALKKAKLLKQSKNAVIGVNSNGFEFVKKYKKYDYRFVTVSSKTIESKMRKERVSRIEVQRILLKKNKELISKLFDKDFQIDVDAATNYLVKLKNVMKRKIESAKVENEEVKDGAKKSLHHFLEHATIQLHKFNDISKSENTPKIQERGKRIHSKVSTQMSILRNFLTYKGQHKLVYLDIKNSQPFHITEMLKKTFWERNTQNKGITLEEQDKELYNKLRKDRIVTYHNIIRCLNEDIQSYSKHVIPRVSAPNDDVKNFCVLVTSGKLYEFISDKFKGKSVKSGKKDPFRDRKSTKQAFIEMLYSDTKKYYSESSDFMKEFKKLFPTVARIILLLKHYRNNDLAFLLQSIEATFILEKICGSLSKEYPDIPLYTIHDGIITTEEYAVLLEEKIKEVYENSHGLVPAIKKEHLHPDVAKKSLQMYSDEKAESFLTEIDKFAELGGQSLEELVDTWKAIFEIFEEKSAEEFTFGYIPDYSFLES